MTRGIAAQFVCIGVLAAHALAQTTGATLQGTVQDNTGGVIIGARVKVESEDRAFMREVTTNETGYYQVPYLLEGSYRLTATASGFRTLVHERIVLETRQVRRVDFTLEIGSPTEQLTVVAEAPVINTENQTISQTYTGLQLDRPTSLRKFSNLVAHQFVLETPGAGQGIFTFYGARWSFAKKTVDGIETPEPFWTTTPVEGTAEVKAMVLNASAEYATPETVDVVTKGGTNQFHGLGAIELRHGRLRALGPWAHTRPPSAPEYYWTGAAGGPVYVPKIYDGRNRTFWHLGLNYRNPGAVGYVQAARFPTTAFRNGDLSELLPATQLKHPFTGAPITNNNLAAAAPVNTVARNVLEIVPRPQQEIVGVNASTVGTQRDKRYNYNLRVDQRIANSNTLTFTYLRQPTNGYYDLTVIPNFPRQLYTLDGWNIAISDTHVFSPGIVNQFRFGYGTQYYDSRSNTLGNEWVQKLGLQGIAPALPNAAGLPAVSITGFSGIGGGSQSRPDKANFQWQETLTVTSGSHTVKAGLDIRRFHWDEINAPSGTFGSFSFDGRFTGSPFADFWFGLPATSNLFYPRPKRLARMSEIGWFVQDDFRVTRSLTLNYGLRHEIFTVPHDEAGLYLSFDSKTGSIVVPSEKARAAVNPNFNPAIPIITAAEAGYPAKLLHGDKNNLYPRVGFAYRAGRSGRTVVRGGYGLYVVPWAADMISFGGPFAVSVTYDNAIQDGSARFQLPSALPPGIGRTGTPSVTFLEPGFVNPYVQQWNLTVERQVGEFGLRASYIGTKGTKLGFPQNINRPLPSTTPFTSGRYSYSNFMNVNRIGNGGNDIYNALELGMDRPFKNGLYLNAGYTLAKQLSDTPSSRFEGIAGGAPENPYDRRRERGNGDFTTRHAFVSRWVYDAPVGNGQPHLNNLSGPGGALLNGIIGNWSLSGVLFIRSGAFFSPSFTGSDPSGTNYFGGRPDVVAGCDPNKARRNRDEWFNAACFEVPPANSGRFGTAARNSLVGPGLWKADVSFFKYFPIREQLKLRFSMMANNLFNTINLGNPPGSINVPGGTAISSPADARTSDPWAYYREVTFELRLQY